MSGDAMAIEEASTGYVLPADRPGIPAGYKQSELGILPEDWEIAPLSNAIAKLEAGVSVNSVDETHRTYAHDQSVLKTSSISDGRFFPAECKKVDPKDLHRLSLNPETDTLLISRMNTPDLVGECGYIAESHSSLFLPDRLWMTRRRDNSEVDFRWLSYLLSSKPQKSRIQGIATGTSGSMKNISKGSLLRLSIPFPTPKEQRAIATALSDVDALLEELDRLIAKKRDLKQATMQQLLTGQTRLPGFEGEWERKRLGDVAEMGSGGTPLSSVSAYYDGDIPWVAISDMTKSGKVIENTERYLTNLGLANSAAQMFPAGTVLYAMYASLGECSIAGVSLCTSQAILGIRPKSSLNADYLYYFLTSLKSHVRTLGQQGTQANLNKGMVQNFNLALPTVAEQTAIAAALSHIDTEIDYLEQRRAKTAAIKQAMMQELLTGRTRLL